MTIHKILFMVICVCSVCSAIDIHISNTTTIGCMGIETIGCADIEGENIYIAGLSEYKDYAINHELNHFKNWSGRMIEKGRWTGHFKEQVVQDQKFLKEHDTYYQIVFQSEIEGKTMLEIMNMVGSKPFMLEVIDDE